MKKKIMTICNHDINCERHTMNISGIKMMVNPEQKYAVCNVCKEPFVYIKKQGIFVLKEDVDG